MTKITSHVTVIRMMSSLDVMRMIGPHALYHHVRDPPARLTPPFARSGPTPYTIMCGINPRGLITPCGWLSPMANTTMCMIRPHALYHHVHDWAEGLMPPCV